MQYSEERKASVLKKMIPPHNPSLSQLAVQEGISKATLFNWRKEARSKGILMPDGDAGPSELERPGQVCGGCGKQRTADGSHLTSMAYGNAVQVTDASGGTAFR